MNNKNNDDLIGAINSLNSLVETKENLVYFKEENTMVHLVLTNKRFYNGKVLDVRETMIILDDKKLGKIPIPLKDIYLIETFQKPGGKEDGEDGFN
jgi:hypothetical protein